MLLRIWIDIYTKQDTTKTVNHDRETASTHALCELCLLALVLYQIFIITIV